MDVAGGAHRLSALLPQAHDLPVDLLQILHGLYGALFIPQHEHVVAQGLDLQIVIKPYQPLELRVSASPQDGLVKLPGFAGRADDQSLPVLV